MRKLYNKKFISPSDLVEFVNEYNLTSYDIQSIIHEKDYIILYYWYSN